MGNNRLAMEGELLEMYVSVYRVAALPPQKKGFSVSYKRLLLLTSLFINFAVASAAVARQTGATFWLREKYHSLRKHQGNGYNERLSVFEQLSVGPRDTVLLGDSIAQFGEWSELLNDPHVKNRGIGGDTTTRLVGRLEEITSGKPRNVVLICGINNLQEQIPLAQTKREYAEIVSTITDESPMTDVWMVQVFPINKRLYQRWIVSENPNINIPQQADVEELNGFIKSLVSPHVHFVGVPEILAPSGELSESYTLDGLHPSGSGLKEIAHLLFQSLPALHQAQQSSAYHRL